MNDVFNAVRSKIGKPYDDLFFLLTALREVLEENDALDIAKEIPWINTESKGNHEFSSKYLQLYSLVFQLINMVEINLFIINRVSMLDNLFKAMVRAHALHFVSHLDCRIADGAPNAHLL